MLARKHTAVVRGAFTLMEMLVVVAILVVLAGAAVPIYMKYLDEAKVDRARLDCQMIADACQAYKIRNGDYPASLQILTQPDAQGGTASLEVSALLDPWGREYHYQAPGTHNAATGKPDVWSDGPRPGDASSMIGNWR
jgi:general secretion pathway protein G